MRRSRRYSVGIECPKVLKCSPLQALASPHKFYCVRLCCEGATRHGGSTSIMYSRGFRILVLIFVTVWFGAIVPGHTRGVVRLPGVAGCTDQTSNDRTCCGERSSEPSKGVPTSGGCAVCFFAAALMHAPPISLDFANLGLVGSLAPPLTARLDLRVPYLPYQSRAPPVT